MLLKDGTCVTCKENSTDSNSTFNYLNKVITIFNSKKLFDIFGVTYSSWNNTGVKPDGSSDYIYFDLEDNLNLNIYFISELR